MNAPAAIVGAIHLPQAARIGLRGAYWSMIAARDLVLRYRATGQDDLEAKHDQRALAEQGSLIRQIVEATGLTAEQLRDILS